MDYQKASKNLTSYIYKPATFYEHYYVSDRQICSKVFFLNDHRANTDALFQKGFKIFQNITTDNLFMTS